MPIAVVNAWPALMARDSMSSASGNCSSNRRSRTVRFRISTRNGTDAPAQEAGQHAPAARASTAASANAVGGAEASEVSSTVLTPIFAPA